MSDVFERVKKVIVEVMKVNPDETEITLATDFVEDLKADSMDQFFLIDGFCEEFDVDIPDEAAREIKTVGDVVKHLEEL
ncbi:MAG: acyl carrier protein [Anaerolineaceae bacterium]|nr:acyl carrier protein [Anaerolineaceae bacterium]